MIFADADFETRSRCDLKLAGAEAYSEHPTTEVLCLVVRTSLGGKFVWWPGLDTFELEALVDNPDCHWIAHNAAFEQAIWRNQMMTKFRLGPIPINRWSCTLAAAAWKSLPLALEKLIKAVGSAKEKDMEGRKLTLSLSKPITKKAWMEQSPGTLTKKDWAALWPKDTLSEVTPVIRGRVIAYCDRDVEGEEDVKRTVGLLHSQERGIWELDQQINQRGVRLDLDFVRAAQRVVIDASVTLRQEFEGITGGVGPGQVVKIKEWCHSKGVSLDNLQKATIEKLLDADPEDADAAAGIITNAAEDDYADSGEPHASMGALLSNVPHVRRVLEIRQLLGSASIKKLARMRACVGSDGRARGLIQYHAAHTGRWGGRLFQPQNFPRGFLICNGDGSPASQEDVIRAIMTGNPDNCSWFCRRVDVAPGVYELEFIHPIELVAASLRHALVAEKGKVFMVGDYKGIEACIDLAMAGEHDKAAMMISGEPYLDMAEAIYSQPKGTWTNGDKAFIARMKVEHLAERTIGKNTVLGCGFQMGGKTFYKRYCSHMTEEFAHEVVRAYRKEWAPKVPYLWYGLGDAALEAVQYQRPHEAYGVEYRLQDGNVVARLPSGWQHLWYPRPSLEWDDRFNKHCWAYSAWQGGTERRKRAYGGLLTENAVQALARGLLVGSMFRVEDAGWPIVLTVHDEIVAEVDEDKADQKAFEALMAERSQWAVNMKIPVAVDGWCDTRYRK